MVTHPPNARKPQITQIDADLIAIAIAIGIDRQGGGLMAAHPKTQRRKGAKARRREGAKAQMREGAKARKREGAKARRREGAKK